MMKNIAPSGACIIKLWYIRTKFQCFFISADAVIDQLFHDGDRYHIETSPLICSENQWTGFYMITASVMKVLKQAVFDIN